MKSLRSGRFESPHAFLLLLLFLFAAAAVMLIVRPVHLSTSFTSMIPLQDTGDGMTSAVNEFTERQNAGVNLFVSGTAFSSVRSAALEFYGRLEESGAFDALSLDNSAIDAVQLFNAVSGNVYNLLDSSTQERIVSDPAAFADDSLAAIFSAFTVSSLSNLDDDPFLLSETVWTDLISKVGSLTTFSPKDRVLATEVDGTWYVLIQGTLNEEGRSLSSADGGVRRIFSIGEALEAEYPDIEISYSGLAFHSYESATGARREMTLISVVSVVLILLLFFLLCRNFHILWLFLLSLTISVGSAASVLVLFFRDIHVLSLVFGTSLIGTCIDYSIHSYICAAQSDPDGCGFSIRRKIGRSLTLSFISTELCYLVLLLSSYGILRQMAVISLSGLLSSYLTAMVLYPRIITARMVNRQSFVARPSAGSGLPFLLPWLAAASTILVLVQLPRMRIANDITSLYTPSERMLRSETVAAEAMGYRDTTYAIIGGTTQNDALEREYLFCSRLEELKEDGLLEGYVATVMFVPPISRQELSRNAAASLLPYLDDQCDILDVDEEHRKAIVDRITGNGSWFTIESLPDSLRAMTDSISLGEIEGKYYEVVIIRNASDTSLISAVADGMDDVRYIMTAKDTGAQLDNLTAMMLRLFGIAFGIIVIVMVAVSGWRKGLRMSLAPYTILTGTVGVLVLFGLSLDFFMTVGLVLIVGLGLDYMVFASSGRGVASGKAVMLSFVTTELSFGSLAFSSFAPVHIFGLTVFVGILIAYACTIGASRE